MCIGISFNDPIDPFHDIKPVIKAVTNVFTLALTKASKVRKKTIDASFEIMLGIDTAVFRIIPDTVDKDNIFMTLRFRRDVRSVKTEAVNAVYIHIPLVGVISDKHPSACDLGRKVGITVLVLVRKRRNFINIITESINAAEKRRCNS
ncbi:hypothetical protein D6856_05165 [Butyrivibrio sp. XB500-5]|nr:hypothetical protein D6856_05165 [Butyrivibrio sp. XB500-5]